MVKQLAKGKQRLTEAYWSAVGMVSVAMLSGLRRQFRYLP